MDALLMELGALELYVQIDPHAVRLAEEPGWGVSMDALLFGMWMHTDTWSLWMPYHGPTAAQWHDFYVSLWMPSTRTGQCTLTLLMLLLQWTVKIAVISTTSCLVNSYFPYGESPETFLPKLIEEGSFLCFYSPTLIPSVAKRGKSRYHIKYIYV